MWRPSVLTPYPAEEMNAYQVSPRRNNPLYNTPRGPISPPCDAARNVSEENGVITKAEVLAR